MKKVLVIGNGAREQAIAEALVKSSQGYELVCIGSGRNPGILKIAADYEVGSVEDFELIGEVAKKTNVHFAICGPEAPLALGIRNFLEERGISVVGPAKKSAQLESSKSFTRELLEKYQIPGNPKSRVFFDSEGIRDFMLELKGEYVVKADGLKGGKGVKVAGDHLESLNDGFLYAKECLKEDGKVLIEEKLIGQEFSLMSVSDGSRVLDFPVVQDHKRAFDKDLGPNTGGMGSYSMPDHGLPFLTANDISQAHEINVQVVKAAKEELGEAFRGILYGGFMATGNGIKLIEYNVRFGDPEAMNVLPILETDFGDICEALINKDLSGVSLKCQSKATVCKYAVPRGYPNNPLKGVKIEISELPPEARMYFASVDERSDGIYLLGSRAVAMVGIGDTLKEAEDIAERAIKSIGGPVFHRNDIGTESLLKSKMEMMKKLVRKSQKSLV